ncbi:hypothetical protein BGZ63DRAFT_390304 [Mariannaea sp. PMI_226]|nr:hypothetical protein BGZ63DRAFT_390304 [Mariannaea sp. PMI_226]
MSSILALAAMCKCHDIIVRTGTPSLEDREQIMNLLDLGDRHHSASLRQTHDEIPNTDSYDFVLANAPLMVLFSSANHAVRIQFAQSVANSENLPPDFISAQSQWISLIRAAHFAYTGLLQVQPELPLDNENSLSPPVLNFPYTFPQSVSEGLGDLVPEDGPTVATRQLLLPIVKASSGPALERLKSTAQSTISQNKTALTSQRDGPACHGAEAEACLVALDVLTNIMHQVFYTEQNSAPTTPIVNQPTSITDSPLPTDFSKVSPWLQNYLARVTSATPQKPLRRIITSFLTRVPAEYLKVVQSIIDVTPGGACERGVSWANQVQSNNTSVEQLALDIFAHWLVLMMLLDGVWWIGQTGSWELERVILSKERLGWFKEHEGNWWPQSMHRVVTESKKYI